MTPPDVVDGEADGAADGGDALLSGVWHLAATSRDVAPRRMLRKILFGEPIALGRGGDGRVFALRDVCPHRAAPLSAGRVCEEAGRGAVECPYHGWRFSVADGSCLLAPAVSATAGVKVSGISVARFETAEANGLVWIYRPDARQAGAPPAPDIGLAPSFRPKIVVRERAEGPYDEAVIGLVDPAHTPFVHRQWWWREGAGLKEKVKTFEPTGMGFRMPAHRPSSNSRIYRILGAPTTEIEFRLPGLRLETIRSNSRTILGLTAITPTEPRVADITHVIFWDAWGLDLLKPILSRMAANFLAQDGAILRAQNGNLARLRPRTLYLGDPDEPAKWYLKLKRAWAERRPGEPFVNPVAGGTLRWRT